MVTVNPAQAEPTEIEEPLDDAFRSALREEAQRIFVDAGHSGGGHLQESNRWANWDRVLGVPAVAGSSVLAAGAAASALLEANAWITAVLAVLASGLGAARAFLQTDKLAEAHGSKGNKYLSLRNDARFFVKVDLLSGLDLEVLHGRLRDLRSRYNGLNESPPHRISPGARAAAKEGIDSGDMSYEGDPLWKEIRS